MKNSITIAITLLFLLPTISQDFKVKDSLIEYFGNNYEQLDPIEGIWVLNVERTLYHNDSIIGSDWEEFRSEWAVVKDNELRFKVVNIGGAEEEDNAINFEAFFERTALNGFYTYTCNFKTPDWMGKSSAWLTDNAILEYGYFTSDAFMEKEYGDDYDKSMRLYWKFTWIKKYPIEEVAVHGDYKSNWKGTGSGFFIDKKGLIATNYHVVADAENIEIELIRDEIPYKYKAELIGADKKNDLAILRIIDQKSLPIHLLPYKIKLSPADVGTQVFSLGYPLVDTMGNEIKFTDGRISCKSGYKGDPTSYQTTTPCQPGNSGSPLFDFDGNIIGITSSFIKPEYADNVSYSIKTEYLQKLVNEIHEDVALQNINWIKDKTLVEKIEILKDYVVMVRVK